MIFRCQDISCVHAPKTGSRSVLGWFALVNNPELYYEHPEYFKEVNLEDHVYGPIRQRQTITPTVETPFSFIIRRDPVKRFISGYKNRVWTHKELGNPPPSFDDFISNFREYHREYGTIQRHFGSLTHYYGTDPRKYTHFFRTDKLYKLKEFLENHFDVPLPDLRLQQNLPIDIKPTYGQEQFIRDLYNEDYIYGWN